MPVPRFVGHCVRKPSSGSNAKFRLSFKSVSIRSAISAVSGKRKALVQDLDPHVKLSLVDHDGNALIL